MSTQPHRVSPRCLGGGLWARPAWLWAVLLLAGSGALAQPEEPEKPNRPPLPVVRIEPFHVQLGVLEPLEEREIELTIVNEGGAPAILRRVSTSCTCTAPDFQAPMTIPPGQRRTLPIRVHGRASVGPLRSTANFFFEHNVKPLSITMAGDVSRAIKAEPFVIDVIVFPAREDPPPMDGEITLTAVDDAPFRVLTVQGEPIENSEPAVEHTVRYDFRGVKQMEMPIWFVVETDHPKAPLIELRVGSMALLNTGQGRGPWDLESDIVMLNRVPAGKTVIREIELLGLLDKSVQVEFATARNLLNVRVVGESMGDSGRRFRLEFMPALGVEGFAHDKLVISGKGHQRTIDVYASVRGDAAGW